MLEGVEAVGKNLLLTFEGGLVLRSHLRMSGRWQVRETGRPVSGRPWLVLRADGHEALLWKGPVLELSRRPRRPSVGPDILAEPPDLAAMVSNPAARAVNARVGRRAARPAPRRRDREPLACRSALARAPVAVARAG